MRDQKDKLEKSGGLAFFLSFPAISYLNFSLSIGVIGLYNTQDSFLFLWIFAGIVLGFCLSPIFTRGKIYVFSHEVKHAIVASLAGNKWKRMDIQRDGGGEYQYSYTKKTAHLNAFIALAPYWFPLLTIPASLLTLSKIAQPEILRILIGTCLTLDLIAGMKDLGPHQSDLSTIRGGPKLAMIYVLLMNMFVIMIVASWSLSGLQGLKFQAINVWRVTEKILSVFI